jgi:hypothetical protein
MVSVRRSSVTVTANSRPRLIIPRRLAGLCRTSEKTTHTPYRWPPLTVGSGPLAKPPMLLGRFNAEYHPALLPVVPVRCCHGPQETVHPYQAAVQWPQRNVRT